MRARRRAVPRAERACTARALARNLSASLRIRGVRRVACYLSNDGEMDLSPTIDLLRRRNRRVLLPALHGPTLWFLPYEEDTALVANRFGIQEPDMAAGRRCPARNLDLVLVPLVAFDTAGNRLGMGGGFYDRTFAYLLRRAVWKKPLLIGVAYAFQQVDALPHRSWDVPLDGIATEDRLYFVD